MDQTKKKMIRLVPHTPYTEKFHVPEKNNEK